MRLRFLAGLGVVAALAGCNGVASFSTPAAPSQSALVADASSKIRHVVIIFQENRTVDNLFNGFPGADTTRHGLNSKGKEVELQPIGLTAPYDLDHTHSGFETEYDGGKLDGFDKHAGRCYGIGICIPADVRAYGYVPRAQTAPYWDMATQYTLADHMFQTNQGPSFPAHQYIVSGTSAIADGSSLKAADQPFNPSGFGNGGCDSLSSSLVPVIDSSGKENTSVYPCFNRISLMQLVTRKNLSWRYYQAVAGAGIWNAPDAVLPVRRSGEFAQDVVAPSSQVLTDIAAGQLADVVWVTPAELWSDHAHSSNGSGPSWVAAVVNAIGKSAYWKNTAIFVTWDDWGGWYDHVPPRIYNSYELGFRVPLIVISPYAKTHYVSHVPHEFGSILKFTEEIFGLGSLHTTDERADDLFDCFDFSQTPTKFKTIPAHYPAKYFLNNPHAGGMPDDDDASAYKTLYSFGEDGKAYDGRSPGGGLIALNGRFYGTTQAGGTTNAQCADGCGTLYDVPSAGSERVLYRFKGSPDGAAPAADLISMNGLLYGTTGLGGTGTNCSGGCGTAFEVDSNGTNEALLHSFAGGTDGAQPAASLLAVGTSLYGTTEYGGGTTRLCPQGCGTVFSLSAASGSETVLHAFAGGVEGSGPVASLIDVDGTLYGTTEYGGARTQFCATGCGTVFKIAPSSGAFSVVHAFKYAPHASDGAYPAAPLVELDGTLYGTTLGGGSASRGTVFEITSTGVENVLHSFGCCGHGSDGEFPLDGLVAVGGTLYGTTREGGVNKKGTVFTLTTAGSENVLYSFAGYPDGAQPLTDLLALDGALYGTTVVGGTASEGTVFRLTP